MFFNNENNSYEDILIFNINIDDLTDVYSMSEIFSYQLKARKIHPELDLTGDGASELMIIGEENEDTYIFSFSNDDNVFTDEQIYRSGYPTMWHNVYLDDFNGDGKTDLLTGVEEDGITNQWQLAYWIGDGFETIELPNLNSLLDDPTEYGIVTNDFNNDGKCDIMKVYSITSSNPGEDDLKIEPYYFNDNDFIKSNNSTYVGSNLSVMQRHWNDYLYQRPIDINGDGNIDIALMDDSGLHSFVKLNPGEYKAGLKVVSNGYDALTKFDYKNLSNPLVYNKGEVLARPYRRLIHPMQVVSEYKQSNGIGDFTSTEYSYKAGVIHLEGKGFLGFKGLEIEDHTSGIESYSESVIDLTKVVLTPVLTETKDMEGNLLSKNVLEYEFKNIFQAPEGVIFPYAATTTSIDYFSGAKSVMQIEYDQYANLTLTNNAVYQSANATTPLETLTTTFSNFIVSGRWCPSLPVDQSITSIRQGELPFTTLKHFTYTSDGNPESVTDFYQQADAVITTYSDYVAGLPGKVRTHINSDNQNLLDRETNTTFDSKYRFAVSVTDAMGYTSSAKYNPGFGTKTEVTDANGLKSFMQYDGFGGLEETRNHLGVWAKQTYNWEKSEDNVLFYLETTSNNAATTQEFYDKLARPLYTFGENPDGQIVCIKTDYDEKGRIISVSEPFFKNSNPTQFALNQYDNYNRLWKTTLPNGVTITQTMPQPGSNSFTVYTYNSATEITTSKTTDASGKVLSVNDPGGTIVYSYYSHGNVKNITSADGSITTLHYDEYGRQISLTDPDAGITNYTYNGYGEITVQTDAKQNSFEMSYDKSGRLLTKKCTKPGYNTMLINTWHPANSPAGSRGLLQKTEYTDESNNYSTYEYTYNHLTQNIQTRITTDRTFSYFYTYDSKGRPDEYTYPSGLTIKNEYNATNGTLKKVIDKSTNTAIYEPGTYNARGQMLHYAMNNKSLYTTLGYNDFGLPTYRMTGKFYPTANGIQYLETNFNNQTGNLNWRKDHSRSLTENFTYDAVHKNRLATWQVQGQQQYGITYNHANGNIITKTDFTSPGNPYTYGLNAGPHAVTGVNAPLLMPAEAQQEISYNSFNKASYINHNYQRRELLLHYGPDEQRIKTEYKINGQTTLTRYFPGGGLEVEVDANGQERWLHYLPGGGLYVCDKNFNKIGMYYVLTDYLGSWHKVISETGTTIEEYSFDPWGRRRNPANWTYTGVPTSFTFNRGYTGHEMLDAFGLINMNGRMYDPVMGRMLSPDNYVSSASSTQAFNRYSYALNNPLVITDPSGDMPFLAVMAYVAVSGIISGDMAKDTKMGFWGGFAYGAATAGLSMGVGAIIGPVMPGVGALPGLVNAGINSSVAGFITYGFDAIVNNSPFNWKGWAINVGTAMAFGAVDGYVEAVKYNKLMGPRPFGEPMNINNFSGKPVGQNRTTTSLFNWDKPDEFAYDKLKHTYQPPGSTNCVPSCVSGWDPYNRDVETLTRLLNGNEDGFTIGTKDDPFIGERRFKAAGLKNANRNMTGILDPDAIAADIQANNYQMLMYITSANNAHAVNISKIKIWNSGRFKLYVSDPMGGKYDLFIKGENVYFLGSSKAHFVF